MKTTWEADNLMLGDRMKFEVRTESGYWSSAAICVQDTGESENPRGHIILLERCLYIGPFHNKEALVGWMNTSGRVRPKA